MTQLIIFDLDGTLFDTRADIADAVNAARLQFGLPSLSLEKVTEMVGFGVEVLAERAFGDSNVNLEVGRAAIVDHYTSNPAGKAQLYPGVIETLDEIEAIRTIVSNKPYALVKALLEAHELTERFSFIAGGDTFAQRKPDPMALEHLMKLFDVPSVNVIVVGDHSPDIEMAKRAGARSVYCNYGFFGDDRIGADHHIDHFAELLPILESLAN